MTRPIVASLILTGLLFATEANAQGFYHKKQVYVATPMATSPIQQQAVVATTPNVQAVTARAVTTPTYSPSATYPAAAGWAAVAPSRVYSYSYYTLSPLPARTYVGYGTNDFPFHGTPYGHPYDPYTFAAMAGPGQSGLARYYDPPVK